MGGASFSFARSRGMACWRLTWCPFFILSAWCQNRETRSVSQVDILWLLRDVGGGDMQMRTCQCHLSLLFTNVFASKMGLVRGAQRYDVLLVSGVLGGVCFSHVAWFEGDCTGRRTTPYGSHVTKRLVHNSCSGEFVPGATRRSIMCGARWCASCVSPPCLF